MANYFPSHKGKLSTLKEKQLPPKSGGMPKVEKNFSKIGARVLWHRTLIGLTQREYAERAGLERSQVKNWETGNYRLSLDGALALRRTYGLSLDFMFEGIADALPMTLMQAWQSRPEVNTSK